jgi:hypothetical protein
VDPRTSPVPTGAVVAASPSTEPAWPDATVALLTREPGDLELETLRRLRAQRYPGSVSTLVIDSSADPSAKVSSILRAAADHWEAIPPGAFRHAGTRNRALDACTTPVILYLSGDAHPVDELWMRRLVQPLRDGRAHASYGRQQVPAQDREREATYAYLYPDAPEVKTKASIPELGLRTFHFSDVTSAFVTDVLRRLRFPDELAIFEDVGIAKRLLDNGYGIAYVPGAAVLHSHQLSPRAMAARYRRIGFVYESLGIFDDLRRAGRSSLLREGLRVARDVSPSDGRLRLRLGGAAVGGIKLASVAWGRWEGRRARDRRARPL